MGKSREIVRFSKNVMMKYIFWKTLFSCFYVNRRLGDLFSWSLKGNWIEFRWSGNGEFPAFQRRSKRKYWVSI